MKRNLSVFLVCFLLFLCCFFVVAVPASGMVYTDAESGVTFTVPANWKQKTMSKDRDYLDVKFVPTEEDGNSIIYGATDMWGMMSSSEREGIARQELNNSAFSAAEIADLFGASSDEISTVTYNGTQYYKIEVKNKTEILGQEYTLEMTQLIRIDNGWYYLFQFSGMEGHGRYAEFENLLNSVRYPDVFSTTASTTQRYSLATTAPIASTNTPLGATLLLTLAPLAVVVIAVVVIVKKINRPPVAPPSQVFFCRTCGNRLPSDSRFCHVCGTEIIKEEEK